MYRLFTDDAHVKKPNIPISKIDPKEIFTILIWGSDREKFGSPELEYKGLRVCATGKITSYRGVPEINATERGQIEIQK